MRKYLLIYLMLFSSQLFSYEKAPIGCFTGLKRVLNLPCSAVEEDFNFWKKLTTQFRQGKKESQEALSQQIWERAQYFLDRKEYDYFSVVALMVFPVKDKEKGLLQFKKLPGTRVPAASIALDRVAGKNSSYCKPSKDGKKIPFTYQEICSLKIL